MLTEDKKQVQNKPVKRNYNAKLKLDMSFKEALTSATKTKIKSV